MAKIKTVSVREIKTSGENPRQIFDRAALAELKASIKGSGLHTPITVATNGGGYMVIDGERRLICLKQLNVKKVDVLLEDADEEKAGEMRLTLNLQREDLHPLDEAAGYRRLQHQYKYSVQDLAGKLGKPASYITMRLQLNELCADGVKMFKEGKLSPLNAMQISRLQPDGRQGEVLKDIRSRVDQTPAQISNRIREHYMLELKAAPFDTKQDGLAHTPPCTSCLKRSGNDALLFPDLAKDDVCSNAACFGAKARANAEAAFKQAEGDPGIVILDPKKKAMYNKWGQLIGDYTPLDRNCYRDGKDRKYSQLVSVHNKENPGAKVKTYLTVSPSGHLVRLIKDADTEKVYKSVNKVSASGVTASEKAARKRELDKRRRTDRISDLLAQRMVEVAEKAPLSGKWLYVVTCATIRTTYHDHRKAVVARRGWELVKVKPSWGGKPVANHETTLLRQASSMDTRRLTGLLVELLLTSSWGDAKILGVSLEATSAEVDKQIRQEKAAKPKAKAKKKSGRKK